jgi:hypothetical protein
MPVIRKSADLRNSYSDISDEEITGKRELL